MGKGSVEVEVKARLVGLLMEVEMRPPKCTIGNSVAGRVIVVRAQG